MKTIRSFVVVMVVLFATGCASLQEYDDTATGAVAGGLIGGALGGNSGARTGALLGAGIGALVDSKDRKDAIRGERIERMISVQTQGVSVAGGGNAQVAGALAETEKNIAFAKGERDKCQARFAVYKKAGIKRPYNCEQVFEEALRRAEDASAIADPLLYNAAVYGGCSDAYLRSHGVRPGSRHADMWCRQLRERDRGHYYGYRR